MKAPASRRLSVYLVLLVYLVGLASGLLRTHHFSRIKHYASRSCDMRHVLTKLSSETCRGCEYQRHAMVARRVGVHPKRTVKPNVPANV